jgi:hypothetical protein
LQDARQAAERLLAGLIARRDDFDRSAGPLPADQLAAGRQAMSRAIDATRAVIEAASADPL